MEDGEFQDWELLLLHKNSDEEVGGSVNSSSDSAVKEITLEEGDSEGMIRTDYFSLDYSHSLGNKFLDTSSVESSSDNPSWIDPEATEFPSRKESGGGVFWTDDSGSDKSDDHRKFSTELLDEYDDAKSERKGFVENAKSQVGFPGIEEISIGAAEAEDDFEKLWSDSGGRIGPISLEIRDLNENSQEGLQAGETKDAEGSAIGAVKSGSRGEEKKKGVVWWKFPFVLLKYCTFRVSPVWTFSVAAAVMGFIILGRRLYKKKRKSQTLQVKVTMDDKKVSQFMSRVARLNEAFLVVKRVPVIRPSLPAAGVTPWPLMSLR